MSARGEVAGRCGLVGAGIGIMLYAVFGLMQGAALGGTAGVLAANWVFGPGTVAMTGADPVTRLIVGGSMLAGVVVSLVMFVTAAAAAGYASGWIIALAAGLPSGAERAGNKA